jgi:predicted AAA+ superfamily ATPase
MEEKDSLLLLNEWWKSGRVSENLAKAYKRKVFGEAWRLLNKYRQVLLVTGLRRVGKSTLMYQLISSLISKGVKASSIVYFSFDIASAELTKLLDAYTSLIGVDWKKEKIYVFLDEVQKLKAWSSQVKVVYDAFPNIKFVLSGSASLQLENETKNNLAGRYFVMDMKPLSIIEYYELKTGQKIGKIELYESELRNELESYIKKPFPEIASWKSDAEIKMYIKESIIAKITRSDLPDTFVAVNFVLLEGLLNLFYSKPGMIVNIDKLASDFQVSKTTLENHLFYLGFAKLIRIVKNYRPNVSTASRKLKKVYPYDASLALAIANVEWPYVIETIVASALDCNYYWRIGNKEIDFVMTNPLVPIEVKSSREVVTEASNSLAYFMDRYKAQKGILVYNGEKEERLDNIVVLPLIRLLARSA